jgi:hypothetical protein
MNEIKPVVAKDEEKPLVIGKETIKRLRTRSAMKEMAFKTQTSVCSMCTP